MYATAAKVKELYFYTRLNVEFRSDLCWWHTFLQDWNELSLLCWDDNTWIPQHIVQTDASGSWGCGAFWEDQWLQWHWPPEWAQHNIMIKELVPHSFELCHLGKTVEKEYSAL